LKLQIVETPEDVRAFEAVLDEYLVNDILLFSDVGEPLTESGLAYFRSDGYRDTIAALCARDTDPVHRYFAVLDGKRVGFVMCCTYHSEDGKCFVMEMCIFAPYRGKGLGREAFALLKEAESAAHFELTTSSVRAKRFWESLGFQSNGYSEDGSLKMTLRSAK
jgi:GNAT superfamily N-acetyltransferase